MIELTVKISQSIQNHFRRAATLSIPVPITSVCATFAALSISGIVRGSLFNPFSQYYKFNVQWAKNVAILDGPYGVKLARLSTKVTVRPSLDRNATTLDLTMKAPLKDVRIGLITLAISYIWLSFLTRSIVISDRLIIFSFFGILFYGLIWLNVIYSSNIILKHLPRELIDVDRF